MKTLLISIFFFNVALGYSQIKAVTLTGDTVVLQENGKWSYKFIDSLSIADTSSWRNKVFIKDAHAKLFKKSKNANVGVYFDQSKWGCSQGEIGDPAEYTFMNKDKDLNASFISESTEVELTNMPEIVLTNARLSAPDIELLSQEYRNVNGLKVLCMRLKGTVKGIKANYLYYVFCNETGTVQFVAYASPKKFEANFAVLQNLLNGLSQTK